ncbi:MAG: thioesterase family protein [Acidimicrobiales bacterium]
MTLAMFDHDGERYLAQPCTAGPWDPDHAHGGAVAALLAHLTQAVATPIPMHPVRLTIELLRPVTRVPLTATSRLRRGGRRVHQVEVVLGDEQGREVASGSLLSIRDTTVDELHDAGSAADQLETAGPHEPPSALPRYTGDELWPSGFHEAVDLRIAPGMLGRPGAAEAWVALDAEVVAGQPPTPLERAAAAGDFGNGVSAPLAMDRFLFINPDLTIDLDRRPTGRWVGIDARSVARPDGIGRTQTALRDQSGSIGVALQSLVVDAI